MAVKKTEQKGETKEERIDMVIAKLERDFGKGTVMGANDKAKFHEYVSTGSLGLDQALGIGGLPKGRIIEIYGPESSGKTTIAIHTIAEAQKNKDVWCAYVDAEHAFDTAYAEALGVNLDKLKISQPSYGEQALEVTEKLAESGEFDVIVVDSVAALIPKAEKERQMGESSMGKQAMLMSQAMRKLTPVAAQSGTMIIFINQLREKIGVMFGSPETTPGGNALKFYASVRLDIRRSVTKENSVMDGEIKIGNQTTIKVVKNKTAPPFKTCIFDIIYGEGIDKYGELIDMAIESDVITKSGAFHYYGTKAIGQGREKVVQTLKEDNLMFDEIKARVVDGYIPKEFNPVANEKTVKSGEKVS